VNVSCTYYVGDALTVMRTLPAGSVDLLLTSPPFLALRSYLPPGHPDKAKEMGSEPTPGEFIDALLNVVEEADRALAPHGSLVLELGDTYAGSGGAGGDYAENGMREGQERFDGTAKKERRSVERYRNPIYDGGPLRDRAADTALGIRPKEVRWRGERDGWPLDKSLCLIPELLRFALAYGFNPLTGRQTPRWRVRNVVRWCRPNPPVGALCVDADTEALTPDGWKRHDALSDGELIAAYDPRTDSCRFLPAKFVRWEREGEPVVVVDKRKTSQVLTEDHRCWVRTRKTGPHVRLARDLTNDCDSLLAASFDDVPGPAPVTVERAALLGWYIAEGSSHSRTARIVQSATANPHKVERIRALLDADGADYRETSYIARYNDSTMVTFTIKGDLAEWLNLHHKRLPMCYVTTWPEQQARALFDALVDGDGHRRKNAEGILFHQQDEDVIDAMQVLAIRLGYVASKRWQPSMKVWQVTMSAGARWTKLRKWDGEGIRRDTYTGVVWCPMVETSLWLARRDGKTFITGNSDKFRPGTSEMVVACKSRSRYFDLDAVRTPSDYDRPNLRGKGSPPGGTPNGQKPNGSDHTVKESGAPPLDWWKVSTEGYPGAHYATWPRGLLTRPMLSMCPERVCTVCGEPSRRLVQATRRTPGDDSQRAVKAAEYRLNGHDHPPEVGWEFDRTTIGWSDCGHGGAWRPGVVLDPFAGTGTTGLVATGHGRSAVLIDLDERNLHLARERIGMFLTEGFMEASA
jgi:hypothetical protein